MPDESYEEPSAEVRERVGESGLAFYSDLASWWPLFSAPEDYEEEAAIYLGQLRAACGRTPESLLELGCGGGNNASFMKPGLAMTLTDVSGGMLEVSRELNPECEHILGDMRSLRLDRLFDLVFVHDAVCHMATERDLRATMSTAFAHCAPGGAVLFAPDYLRETFRESSEEGGSNGNDGRALRYLSWCWDPDPADCTYRVDYAFLLRSKNGGVKCEQQSNLEGLFSRAQWIAWLEAEGFIDVRPVPLEHSEVEPGEHEMMICRR